MRTRRAAVQPSMRARSGGGVRGVWRGGRTGVRVLVVLVVVVLVVEVVWWSEGFELDYRVCVCGLEVDYCE